MKAIEAKLVQTKYMPDEYLTLYVDNLPLDILVAQTENKAWYEGLVPALSDWLLNEEERRVAWNRILPKVGETQTAPLMVCIDDLDFSCTVIAAEVEAFQDKIVWHRIGLAEPTEYIRDAERIGDNVQWFSGFSSPLTFDRKAYIDSLRAFRNGI